ncbi:MAG: hypothetical protein K6F69_10700, partial [Treponema sp.]|nr:hypothetical protein [Treponema sp.]
MKAQAQKSTKKLAQISVKVQDLINKYPPVYRNEQKERLYRKALDVHKNQHGIVKISRWTFDTERKAPLIMEKLPVNIECVSGYFLYDEHDTDSERVFWLNYADPNLFGYYDSDMFAQDEIQTLEHPLLGAVSEFIDANSTDCLKGLSVEKKIPTPFIVENVPYWLSVNTAPVMENGEKANLYGWMLSSAEQDIIDAGIHVVKDNIKNNILAIAAP